MDTQFVLRVVGIVALVIAVLFAVLAVHYYLTNGIRAVMDDLSGKTRARGVAGVRTTAALDRQRDVSRRAAAQAPAPATAEQPATGEKAPAPAAPAPVEPELVFAVASERLAAAPAPASFRVTRRVVLMSAPQVIAASEEAGL